MHAITTNVYIYSRNVVLQERLVNILVNIIKITKHKLSPVAAQAIITVDVAVAVAVVAYLIDI